MTASRSSILAGCALLAPSVAWAGEPLSMGTALLQTAWALLVVVGLILIIYGVARKRMGFVRMQGGAIKVIEIRHIMPKAAIALVSVRGRELVVGIGGNGQIALLGDMAGGDRPTEFAQVLADQQ